MAYALLLRVWLDSDVCMLRRCRLNVWTRDPTIKLGLCGSRGSVGCRWGFESVEGTKPREGLYARSCERRRGIFPCSIPCAGDLTLLRAASGRDPRVYVGCRKSALRQRAARIV